MSAALKEIIALLKAGVDAHAPPDAWKIATQPNALIEVLDHFEERLAERDKTREELALLGQVFENHGAAMRAAYIEAEIGDGPEAAMQWISNTLAGPGLLPDLDEARRLGGAQAHFDAEYKGLPGGSPIGLAARALLPQPTERRLPMETAIDVMCAGEEVAARARAAGFALRIVGRSPYQQQAGQRADHVQAFPLPARAGAKPARAPATEVAQEWVRNDDDVFTCLMLVGGHNVPREAVTAWNDRQCWEAEDWAIRQHLIASDNDEVERVPMPQHVAAHPPRPASGNSVADLWSN